MLTKLMLIDDYEAIREGIKLLLSAEPDFEVVADVATPPHAYEVVERAQPDVALMSQDVSGVSGPAITRELIRRQPRLRTVMFAARADEDAVREALAAGARGYVL